MSAAEAGTAWPHHLVPGRPGQIETVQRIVTIDYVSPIFVDRLLPLWIYFPWRLARGYFFLFCFGISASQPKAGSETFL